MDSKILELGSVVLLKQTARKVMIVARATGIKKDEETLYFDYAACEYPEGVIKDQLLFFNSDDIAKVLFHGYTDDTNAIIEERILNWRENKERD